MRFDLPDYIEVGQSCAVVERIPVNVDFRVWIELECAIMAQDTHHLQDVLTRILPENWKSSFDMVWEAVMGFYALRNPYPFPGNGEISADGLRTKAISEVTAKNRQDRWYDFDVDFGRIAASFRAVYGIDLFRCGCNTGSCRTTALHWWEFRVLMFQLPPESEFMRVVGYRLADISTIPKSQRKHYQTLKAIYALDRGNGFSTREERDRDMLRRMEKIRKEMSENG